MKFTTTALLLLLPFLTSAGCPTCIMQGKWANLAPNVDWSHTSNPVEPARNGPKGSVVCNPNGHTCNAKTLTPEVCAKQCTCDEPSGAITCEWWSDCRKETVEWNCQCHSVDVPPKGKCKGFLTPTDFMKAEQDKKWPTIPPNVIKKHPLRTEVASFKKRAFGRWGGFGMW